jgi:hypothetical protein
MPVYHEYLRFVLHEREDLDQRRDLAKRQEPRYVGKRDRHLQDVLFEQLQVRVGENDDSGQGGLTASADADIHAGYALEAARLPPR